MAQAGSLGHVEESVDPLKEGEQEGPLDAGQGLRQALGLGQVAGRDFDLVGECLAAGVAGDDADLLTRLQELADDVGTDVSGGTGYQDHGGDLL
nr:hypothetical protein [Nonomuraea turkmeniaca]